MPLEYHPQARQLVCAALGDAFKDCEKLDPADPQRRAPLPLRSGPGSTDLSGKARRRQVADTTIPPKLAKKLLRNRPTDEDDAPARRPAPTTPQSSGPWWRTSAAAQRPDRPPQPPPAVRDVDDSAGDKFASLAKAAKAKATPVGNEACQPHKKPRH
jgi:hypothetical protein